ncbi:MAG: Co2+/Mg2+ efflux protein ApaG [Phycisphaerae bacterium]|jgi:ApaG protein|nr:Co2+/Mg2+ efflux protein ApaG [Phycisphaerae bacterium]
MTNPATTAVAPPTAPASPAKFLGSETVTDGVRIRVAPSYLSAQSDPAQGKYLFAYHITITNDGDRRATLRSRHWLIVDANGQRHEVKGPGVVGQFPELATGEKFEYSSFCPLETPWGTMEGSYEMERDDGSVFQALVSRFYLVSSQR